MPAEASSFIADVPSGRLAASYIADIAERVDAERKILHAARHDPLTGLPNRALIYALGTHLLQSAKRHNATIAILFSGKTVIALGKKLGMSVIAEGIESQATLSTLVDIGCDFGQGYFISKPIRPAYLVEWYCQAHYRHLFA